MPLLQADDISIKVKVASSDLLATLCTTLSYSLRKLYESFLPEHKHAITSEMSTKRSIVTLTPTPELACVVVDDAESPCFSADVS